MTKTLKRYRVRIGQHRSGRLVRNRENGEVVEDSRKIYHNGQVVETPYDLVALFGEEKFELLHDSQLKDEGTKVADYQSIPAAPNAQQQAARKENPIPPELDRLPVANLKQLADKNGISLEGIHRPEEMRRRIREQWPN